MATILVVEDREDWQAIVCDAVSENGYQPYPTTSYEEALTALDTHQFDLAVVDPVLDRTNPFNRAGVSIIQQLGIHQPLLPVIVVTGSFTADIKDSLDNICPNAPVLFKEAWDSTEFGSILRDQLKDNWPSAQNTDMPVAEAKMPTTDRLAKEILVGQPRILVVENRADWQDILADLLAEAGYFWQIAQNAQEALLALERESFHIVLLDLKLQLHELPISSSEGWLLLDHLAEVFPKTKVVIVSGQAGPSDVAKLLTQYANIIGFVEKQQFSRQKHTIIEAVMQATRAPALRIQTFGQFFLWRDGQTIGQWDRPQSETITKLLLARRATGARAVTTDELITRLWPDADETSGRKKLLPLISNARKTLEPDIEPRDSNFILRSANGYFFDLSGPVTWDLLEFRACLQRGEQAFQAEQWERAIAEFEMGATLYKGDFLAEDRYADWAITLRHDIENDYRDLHVTLADCYAALGRYAPAIAACEVALRKDPLLESVYRRLMRFYYCNHEKGQALRVYRDCSKLFEELFEENPTPATRRLHEMISADQPVACLSER